MNGLVNAIAPRLAVGDTTKTSARAQADAAGDDAGLVANDVAEEVASDDDTIQTARVLDHDHGGAVDELVLQLQLRELGRHGLRHDPAPEPARRQHVGLVQAPHGRGRVAREREVRGQSRDTLDLGARVQLGVPGHLVAGVEVGLLALAEVDAARELADHRKIGAAADRGFQGRELDERVRREEARAQVPVRLHLLAQPQDPLLGTHRARAPFRPADGA